MTLTVGIDARAAAEVPAGRGRYVRELLAALEALEEARDVRFVLYGREAWGELEPARFTLAADRAAGPGLARRAPPPGASREVDVFLSTNSYLTAWFCLKPTAVVVYDLVPFIDRQSAHTQHGAHRAGDDPPGAAARGRRCRASRTRRAPTSSRLFPHAARQVASSRSRPTRAFSAPVAAPGHPALAGQPVRAGRRHAGAAQEPRAADRGLGRAAGELRAGHVLGARRTDRLGRRPPIAARGP